MKGLPEKRYRNQRPNDKKRQRQQKSGEIKNPAKSDLPRSGNEPEEIAEQIPLLIKRREKKVEVHPDGQSFLEKSGKSKKISVKPEKAVKVPVLEEDKKIKSQIPDKISQCHKSKAFYQKTASLERENLSARGGKLQIHLHPRRTSLGLEVIK